MIVLHVSVFGNGLTLWGEEPVESAKRRIRKSHRDAPDSHPLHPFAAAGRMLTALDKETIGFLPVNKRVRFVTALFPTRGRVPAPSSSILGQIPESGGTFVICPWKLPVYVLSWREATAFFALCGEENIIAPGLIASEDLMFCLRAFRFAESITVRQQFLPGLRSSKDEHTAIWEPVLVGQDAVYAASLARSMPPAVLAFSGGRAAARSLVDPRSALLTILTGFVDHLVRKGCSGLRLSPAKWTGRAAGTSDFNTVHDLWLRALKAPEGTLKLSGSECTQLEKEITDWRSPVDVAQDSKFRLCFRLSEPAGTRGDDWRLGYFIQSLEDRSLLIPLRGIWSARTASQGSLSHMGSGTKEYALSSLAHAATLSPPIEKSLKKPAPAGCTLTTEEAYQFLSGTALALEQAGYGVMLPGWWSHKGTKLRLVAHGSVTSPAMQSQGGFSFDSIADFQWELALGEKSLSRQELNDLARLKAPLVKLRGQWVEAHSDDLRRAIENWDAVKKRSMTVGEIIRMDLTGTGQIAGLPVAGIAATGWIGALLTKLKSHETFEELRSPEKLSGVLRPYQLRGYSWLAFLRQWGFGACLADDMGLGKTIQVLALVQRDRESGERYPVLIVCPTSVVNNWRKEAGRFTPDLPVMVHHGTGRRRGAALKREAENAAMVISTYGLLQRDLEYLQGVHWAGVVLDEAQNIKNPEAMQSRAAFQLQGGYRIALSGTPVENHVGDLWSIFQFLNPGLLGTKADFKRTYFLPIQTGQDGDTIDRLKRITGPFILRRLKTDRSIISDLPEKMEMKVFCSLTREQASLYQSVLKIVEEELQAADGIKRKGIILATLSKLKQVCNHPAHFLGDNSIIPGRSGKVARLTEMIEEVIATRDRALVFTQFAEMGAILKTHLQEMFGREVPFLHGGTPRKRRDEMVEQFQSDGQGPPVFVLSLKAGGTGLNLTGANHVFHFDRWWNPAVEQQATDRAFRIGQNKNVQVHKFVCAGTLEEKIDEMIERKKGIAEKVVGSGEGWLTELSNDELRDLLTLKTELVGDV